MVTTRTYLCYLRLSWLQFKFISELVELLVGHELLRHFDDLRFVCRLELSESALAVRARAPRIQFARAQCECVEPASSCLHDLLVARNRHLERLLVVLVVAVAALALVVGSATAAPSVQSAFDVQSQRVEVAAVDQHDMLLEQA